MHLRKAIILSFATLLIPTILVSCSKQEKSNSTKKTSKSPAAQEKPLICHIGGTMRPVVAKLAKLYEKKTGQRIEINAAGSGELLAYIENQQHGDLYVCHDPFLDILMKKFHMGVDGWLMAELTPVIVVQKGNPKNIKGIMDFT
ncbi:MAG: substrate-binding domain-containing protein, partial [Verrucomicrobiota bacterium]|nr:substrate-binding domain-containing protein [Verrucomicrobiota bacterium]